jgi:hypothetical protein
MPDPTPTYPRLGDIAESSSAGAFVVVFPVYQERIGVST